MIKSKTTLPYKIFLYLFLITIFFVWYKNKEEPISIYPLKNIEFEGYIEEIKIEDDILTIFLKAEEKLLLKYKIKDKKSIHHYKLGSYIKGVGKIEKVEGNRNFHNFSYQKYLWSKKIYRKCIVEKITLYKENRKISYQIKNDIIKKINRSPNKTYYYTFLLGDTSFIKKEVKESYQKNGISHLFAISGMHISLFSSLLLTILKKICKKEIVSDSICILFLLFYAFLTRYTPSVLRSTIFLVLLTFKKYSKCKINNILLFLYMTCFFLLYNPYLIYHTGFLYSFTISFFLLCYAKKYTKKKYIYNIFILSYLSFLSSFPIQINNNFEVNIISIIMNIFFVPLISYIIFPFTLLSFFIPLDFILYYMIFFLEKASLLLSHFSYFVIFPKISSIKILLYYTLLILYLSSFLNPKYLFSFLLFLYIEPFFACPYLTMIDVDQGDSFFLHSEHKNILIDTGGKISYQKRKEEYWKGKEIIQYIKSKGIKKIDAMFLTHGDADHMKDSLYIVKNIKVKKVIFNKGKDNALEKQLLKYLQKKEINYTKISKGKIKVGKNTFYLLNKENKENENEDSLIVYTKIKKYNILFMGDASTKNEKYLLDAYNLPKMDILKIGHHGSKTSTSMDFLQKIKPTYSFISVGKENKYGHPSKTVLQKLQKINTKIYRTDEKGMVEMHFRKNLVIRSLMH